MLYWNYLAMVRHDVSAQNIQEEEKRKDPEYQDFVARYEKYPGSPELKKLARRIMGKFRPSSRVYDLPLVTDGQSMIITARKMRSMMELPGIVLVSPYERAQKSMHLLRDGWPELKGIPTLWNFELVRERERGRLTYYWDWRVFYVFEPVQREIYRREGFYRYRYPQGENMPDVRQRAFLTQQFLDQNFPDKSALIVSHQDYILCHRAELEDWSEERFISERNKAIANCALTLYQRRENKMQFELSERICD